MMFPISEVILILYIINHNAIYLFQYALRLATFTFLHNLHKVKKINFL